MGPHPAVAAIRLAVRRTLQDLLRPAAGSPHLAVLPAAVPHPSQRPSPHSSSAHPPPQAGSAGAEVPAARDHRRAPLVLAACSGGADSTALAAALAFEAPRLGLRAGVVTVDHGLQPGSAERAREVADRLAALGLDPVEVATVTVGRDGGPEAAARTARYAALDAAAEHHGAVAVLLGHTRDDQAETVLLGLARGSGTRSLAGMSAVSSGASGDRAATGRYLRPFLTVDRATARRACDEQRLPVWDDPHNADPAYTRSRIRHEALPALEKALGRGIADALARTAQLARDDADALDSWAQQAERMATRPDGTLDIAALHALPPAVRRRVLRRAAIAAGAPAGSLFARHIEETDRLITAWHGQRPLNLPGRVEARRQGGRLVLEQAGHR
ncbi:tRNA lysidine(34) synthetase TilS [Streptomyces otsuchiensis]|uniref:tRNA lysidine(34) synthetase TilS n=3 Tax=Streptomyces TaxID=1883 RepID=UPI00103106D4|nr:tRNA lysidine(34) synthetase TilS [Streptomyces otsuchiensis]